MGTNSDENAAAPVAAKTQHQIDRNNGKLWDWETALRLLNAQTHYPVYSLPPCTLVVQDRIH